MKQRSGNEGWPVRSVAQVVACSLLALSASVSSCSNEPEVVNSSSTSDGSESTTGGGTRGGAGGSGGAVGTAGGGGGTTAGGGAQSGNGGTTPTTSTSMGGGGEAGTPGLVVPEEPELVFEGTQLPGASGVTDFGFIPGTDDELLVLLHSGVVIHYERAATSGFIELGRAELTDDIFFDEGCGLLSLAFDPEFETNRFIYLARCKEQTVSTIARFELDDIEALPATETEILSVEAEVAEEDWHRFGSMGFEPDGETMWALVGDLFLRQLAQDPQHKAGKLLRFKPSRDAAGSGNEPADGNAFDDASAGDPSIYAYGLRSPWRGTRDRFGRFWIGDVGLVTTEEVNLVLSAGQNLGWDRAEGPCVTDCEGITQPLVHYGRLSDEPYAVDDPLTDPDIRRAIWVGEAYHSDRDRYYGLFDDAVIFGDFFAGWVRRLEVDDEGTLIGDELVGHLEDVTSWKTGPDGYMYVTTLPGVFHRAVQVTESE